MSAITPYQCLELPIPQTPQSVAVKRKLTLLKPQDILYKNLLKLGIAHAFCGLTAAVTQSFTGLSVSSYDTLNQICITCFGSAVLTILSAISVWGYFVRSNKEKRESITPEMKIAIRDQIALAIREREVPNVRSE